MLLPTLIARDDAVREWRKENPRRMDESDQDYSLRMVDYFYDFAYQDGYADGVYAEEQEHAK